MIVIDAAALVDLLTVAPGTDRLRTDVAGADLHAPALLDYEVVSALRGQVRAGRLSVGRAELALDDLEQLTVQRWGPAAPLRRRAFALRDSLSAYDAAYVALAETLACPLLTRDARLGRSHGHHATVLVR